jgi:cellulose synthase/poly-beta-1,6-N-acetylglucosamine synthase-like glycosyltransferase
VSWFLSPVAVPFVTAYLGLLGVLSAYGLHRLFILWLYARNRRNAPRSAAFDELPRVTVQLPVFNERAVVERLIEAACALDWPADRLQIQVLDDSTDDTVALSRQVARRFRAEGVDVEVLHRVDRVGYKAGALAAGTEVATGEFLAVFDADFVPPRDFLRKVMPHFADRPSVGMVQARWGHLNEHGSLLTRLEAVLLDGHFVLEHTARHRSGRFFNFNGTAGVWRRDCIQAAGGWQHDTLTEDLDLSYRAQLAGWQFVFLKDDVVPAELPPDMAAFKTQQHRWAKGTIQTARKLLGTIVRSPVPLRVKAEAFVHLTNNLAYPLVLGLAVLLPPTILLRGRSNLTELLVLDLPAFLLSSVSVAVFYIAAETEAHGTAWGRIWRVPLVMSLGIGMAVNQSRAVVEGLFGRDVTFVRTPKAGDVDGAGLHLPSYLAEVGWTPFVELALALYFAVSVGIVLQNGWYASLPFLLLFGFGFGYVGLSSLRPLFSRPMGVVVPATDAG